MTKHVRTLSVVIAMTGCVGSGTTDEPIDPPIDPPTELSPIERCLTGGGQLQELWATSNLHGPVTSIAVEGTTIVLGSADGSVKQWSVDGSEPFYGAPFLDDTGVGVGSVAFTGDGSVVGADANGRVTEWELANVSMKRMTPVGDAQLVAVASNADFVAVARGELDPNVTVITRATGAVSEPLPTTLWGAQAVAFAPGGLLFTAGHNYGVPSVERRLTSTPAEAVDVWFDRSKLGHILSMAVDPAVTKLVTGGDGFIAILAPDQLAEPLQYTQVVDHVAVGTVLLGRDLFATAGREGALKIWSKNADLVQSLGIPEPVGIGIDGAGTTLFTSGPDGELHAFGCR